jgi:hypothetical protein
MNQSRHTTLVLSLVDGALLSGRQWTTIPHYILLVVPYSQDDLCKPGVAWGSTMIYDL